jgi:uncharacterized OsmC-like protein
LRRGTLDVDRDAPAGFTNTRLNVEIGGINADQKTTLLKLTERHCVVYQTLRNTSQIDATMHSRAL